MSSFFVFFPGKFNIANDRGLLKKIIIVVSTHIFIFELFLGQYYHSCVNTHLYFLDKTTFA
jgi:hypothetical protein